jgi:prolyl oligopeptidase
MEINAMSKVFTHSLTIALVLVTVGCNDKSSNDQIEADVVAVPAESVSVLRPPVARVETVSDQYHGIDVEDPYRWLETWDNQEVKDWSEEQNAYARSLLAALPERPAVHARITEILKSAEAVQYYDVHKAGSDSLLAMKQDPAKQQDLLVIMGADADPADETILVDPNELDPDGGTSIDWIVPSHAGDLVAVSMSSGGSESGDVHVFRLPSGERTGAVIERVNGGTAGGDLAWFTDDSGFYYTRYPRPGERNDEDVHFYQQVWKHVLGTPAENDEYVIGKDFPRIVEIRLMIDRDSGRLLVWTQDGDSNRFGMHLRQPDGAWVEFSDFGDGAIQAAFGPDNALYVISRAGAPQGKLIRLDARAPQLDAGVVVIPEGEGALLHSFYTPSSPTMLVAEDRLYLVYQMGGPNDLRVFSLSGEPLDAPEQMEIGRVAGLTSAGGSDVIFSNNSYLAMPLWRRFSAEDGTTVQLAISSESPVDYSDVEVVREFATSKDGTQVPVNILMPRGTIRDGSHPILVTGYGGYGISISPSLSISRHILFENGVLFAQANLRGGGEYGEQWHRQGNLTNKQNVFDDFVAVIRYLVERRYASPDRVAIVGGSNGGLLMGATIVQNPDLVAAAVSHVGIYDMLRVELDPNGQFNIPEFGTVENPEHFAALRAYSPYHNLQEGVSYPPILLPTGANDPRVNPAHSRKFTARLQAVQGGGGMVLLRTSGDTGHGGGTPLDEVIELLSDQYAFVFHHLGVDMVE